MMLCTGRSRWRSSAMTRLACLVSHRQMTSSPASTIGGGVHLQTAVAAEDGHDACGNLRQMREEFTDRAAHQRTARLGAHGDEACKPFSEFLNLNGFGKVNELDEIAHERLLGPDDGRCFKAFLAQNAGIVSKLVVADAGDAGRNVEDAGAEHRYDEVRLVARGDGDQHVRIGRACIGRTCGWWRCPRRRAGRISIAGIRCARRPGQRR